MKKYINCKRKDETKNITICTTMLLSLFYFSLPPRKEEEKGNDSTKGDIL
jgi:hypothetical protein